MPVTTKPSKHARTDWGPSLTEPEHESELTPQAIIRKLKSGLVPPPGSMLFGYEEPSIDYITRKQKVMQAKHAAEKAFKVAVEHLKAKKVKYKIPKTFDEFRSNQYEFQRFADEFEKSGGMGEESSPIANQPPVGNPTHSQNPSSQGEQNADNLKK